MEFYDTKRIALELCQRFANAHPVTVWRLLKAASVSQRAHKKNGLTAQYHSDDIACNLISYLFRPKSITCEITAHKRKFPNARLVTLCGQFGPLPTHKL